MILSVKFIGKSLFNELVSSVIWFFGCEYDGSSEDNIKVERVLL